MVGRFIQVVEFKLTDKLSKSVQKSQNGGKISYAISQQQFTYLFVYSYFNYQNKKNNR